MRVRVPFDAGRFFSWTAIPYDFITSQRLWREHCREMMEWFPPPPWRVLDVGCGPGNSALEMARAGAARVVGVDLAAGMLRWARRAVRRDPAGARVALVRADATRLPFPDAAFDAVTGHSFLYLTPDPDAILRDAVRVLRPGGAVVLLEPSAGLPGADLVPHLLRSARFTASMIGWRVVSGLHRRYTAESLRAALEGAGLVHVAVDRTLWGMGLLARGYRR